MAQQPSPQQLQTNVGLGGPQWANPNGVPIQNHLQQSGNTPSATQSSIADQHENALFAPISTLDEPVKETIMRDVRSVGSKLKVVLLPMERSLPYGGYSGVSQS